jgi:hypothetical protein
MRLKEWRDANGNKVKLPASTGATKSNSATKVSIGSFKNRLVKLIDYAKAHKWSKITNVEILEITDDSLKFIEHYDSGVDITYDIYIGSFTEAWKLKIYSSVADDTEKPILDRSGIEWVDLLKTIREYIIVPVVGTPEYKDLLMEWVDANGKKVTTASSKNISNNSPATLVNSKDQTERYKKLLAKIDSEKKYTYKVKELSNRVLAIVIDSELIRKFVRIIYSPSKESYLVQISESPDVRCDAWKTALQVLVGAGIIKNTSESIDNSSYADDFKLYENLWD